MRNVGRLIGFSQEVCLQKRKTNLVGYPFFGLVVQSFLCNQAFAADANLARDIAYICFSFDSAVPVRVGVGVDSVTLIDPVSSGGYSVIDSCACR